MMRSEMFSLKIYDKKSDGVQAIKYVKKGLNMR